jgi:hypothetical protein
MADVTIGIAGFWREINCSDCGLRALFAPDSEDSLAGLLQGAHEALHAGWEKFAAAAGHKPSDFCAPSSGEHRDRTRERAGDLGIPYYVHNGSVYTTLDAVKVCRTDDLPFGDFTIY